MSARSAVFLDRDGVLNRAFVRNGCGVPPASLAELELLDGVVQACQSLHDAGFLLVMVTNQPDVARGTQRRETVESINTTLRGWLPLDDVRVCYHDDVHQCACRKPAPGLLMDAAAEWNIDLRRSFMIGDRHRDVEAGRRAGCQTFLICQHPEHTHPAAADCCVASLAEASAMILSTANPPERPHL
jgi:D-glycero-D-manno-heptose 1,7-bisphosphate phosphatase